MFNFPQPAEHPKKDERDRSDSPWLTEAALLKSFPQFTREYLRNGISYVNLVLLQASIPPYRGYEDEDKDKNKKRGHKKKTGRGKIKKSVEELNSAASINKLFYSF